MGRPNLDVHNIIYWFKNTRAALRRAETRQLKEGVSMPRLYTPEIMGWVGSLVFIFDHFVVGL